MNQNVYVKQYQKNNVETATPEELLIILFNALVAYVKKARNAMVEKNIEDTHNNIIAAQNILVEFIETLDFNVNPSLAENLQSLYSYNIQLLTNANIKKDMKSIDESLGLLTDLRDTWKQAVELSKNSKAAQAENEDEEDDTDMTPEYTGYDFSG